MENHTENETKMENYGESIVIQQKQLLEQAREILVKEMNSDKVIHQLRKRNVLSREEEDNFLQIMSTYLRARRLLDHIIKLESPVVFQQFRLALIKAGHTNLLKYLEINDTNEEFGKEDITQSYEGRCMLHLEGDCHVVAKEFKDEIYIHIRNYRQKGTKKMATRQGIALTSSRWLVLEMKKRVHKRIIPEGFRREVG